MVSKLLYLVGVSLLVIAGEGFGFYDVTPYVFDVGVTTGAMLFGVVLVLFGRGAQTIGA